MIITYIHSNRPADRESVQNRCRNLADAINRIGKNHRAELLDINDFVANTPLAQKLCADSDLLVIHRYLHGEILTAIQYWKARDKTVIVDFDQALNYLTRNAPGYSFWFDGIEPGNPVRVAPPPMEQFKWGLGLVDAATVPSDRLVDDWSRHTRVYKISDYINAYCYPALRNDHGDEIWMGLRARENFKSCSLVELFAALQTVCRQHPEVKFILYGVDGHDAKPDLPAGQLIAYAPDAGVEWASVLPNLDLGLLVTCGDYDLRLGSFNLLEFMISKVSWVASGEATHQQLSRFGKWIQNSTDTWVSVLLDAVNRHALYQKNAAAEPFLFALSQDVHANIKKALEVYADILSSRSS